MPPSMHSPYQWRSAKQTNDCKTENFKATDVTANTRRDLRKYFATMWKSFDTNATYLYLRQ